jgi:DNA polymerase-3 subunit beta
MKITILQENLNQALNHLQKAIPSKPQLPVLSAIFIRVADNACQLSATDLYFGVRCEVQGGVSEEGVLAVPGKEFKEIINSLSPGPIELEYSKNTLKIKSNQANAKIQCLNSEDYPDFPQKGGINYEINAKQIDDITQQVLFSASTDQARPVLTAVLFSFNQSESRVVATDGFRLAILNIGSLSKTETDSSFLIPAKALIEVARIQKQVKEDNVSFSISHELKQAVFLIAGVEIFIRLIEGDYPPYQKIIPSAFTTTVLFDRNELIENIKRAMIFAREASNIIRLSFNTSSDQQCQILAIAPAIGEFKGSLTQVKIEGKGGEIAFNAKYVLDFLQSVDVDNIWFGMSESLKPALFRPEGWNEYQYIVMPFKVTE